jgi:ribosomal protein S18 acetylase RimI-like enzyme
MKISVRKATIQDAEAISQTGSQSFRDTFGWQFDHVLQEMENYVEKTYSVEKINKGLVNDNNVFWLAFADEKPIGFAKLKKHSGYNEDEGFSQLQKIYVLHEYLGTGAGKILYVALEEEWQALNSNFLWLLVEINNKRAIRFYEKKGYLKKQRTEFVIGSQTFEFELMEMKN